MLVRKFTFLMIVVGIFFRCSIVFAVDSFQRSEHESDHNTLIVENSINKTVLSIEDIDNSMKTIELGGEIFSVPQSENPITTCREGFPQLPIISKTVLIPPTSDVELIIDEIQYRIEECAQPVLAKNQTESQELSEIQAASADYVNQGGFWPSEAVTISEPAIMRGNRFVQVSIYPMQYNHQTGQMRFNDIVDFHLEYSGTGQNVIAESNHSRSSGNFNRMIDTIVVNPPQRDNPEVNESGSYLLIYPNVNGVFETLQPLIEWRSRQGWDVHTVEVDNRARTEDVKEIIQEAYDEWENPPEMVVLVGDADGAIGISAYNNTDMDYILLEGNDILPDANIGRISVENINGLERAVEKLVRYEADP
jgi:hypothetical protein